jgi:6-phosphogluconate dehydrogenase (decarboxylating)
MNENILIEIIENIKESAEELKEKQNRNEVEYGELLAYAECLSIIKDANAGYDLKKLGLDFDIDDKYLI